MLKKPVNQRPPGQPAAAAEAAPPMMLLLLLIAAHMPLGLLLKKVPMLSTVHAWGVFAVGAVVAELASGSSDR